MSSASGNLNSDELLELMRAKDAQFDNVLLEYNRHGEYATKSFPAWKYPDIADRNSWKNEKPEIIPYQFTEKAIIREPYATFTRKNDPLELPSDLKSSMSDFQKFSNTDGLTREYVMSGSSPNYMTILKGGNPIDQSQEYLMGIQFAHGFGFGKRIKSIDEFERIENGWKMEGDFQVWRTDQSRYKIIVDEDFIVRKAEIIADVFGALTKFEIETEGLAESEGFDLAQTGLFRRSKGGLPENDSLSTSRQFRVDQEFRIRFLRSQPNLSDQVYDELADMSPPPNTQVDDRVSGTVYFIDKSGKIRHPKVEAVIESQMEDLPDMPWSSAESVTAEASGSDIKTDVRGSRYLTLSHSDAMSMKNNTTQNRSGVFAVVLLFVGLMLLFLTGMLYRKRYLKLKQ